MPIFLDRHDVVEFSAEEVAKLHVRDLEIQDRYGVKFLTYWYDAERRTTFCLVDAPDKETADRVHAEAHGHVANEMIAVDLSAVEAFLGRLLREHAIDTLAVACARRIRRRAGRVSIDELATELGKTWSAACAGEPLADHEAPWVLASLTRAQCRALVASAPAEAPRRDALEALCDLRP